MTREQRIEKYAAAVQEDIVCCQGEQAIVEGMTIGISGCPTDMWDLLLEHDVPEDLHDEVVSRVRCPRCGTSLDKWDEVGTDYPWESAHAWELERASQKHERLLFEFSSYLRESPMLGNRHRVGKRILRELAKAPRVSTDKAHWFRATLNMEHGFGPAPREMVGDQRYNTSGHPSWYFADNHEAAVAEVTSKGKAWVQKFDIGNLGELLDLRSWRSDDGRALDDDGEYRPPHGPLLIALIYCDLLTQRNFDEERERRWKPEYLLTRFVAEAAKQAGFNGILYQSVRYPGDNLVVFDAGWKPTPIGEPYEVVLDEKAQYTRKYFGFNRGKTYEPDWFAELPITGPI